MPAGEPMIEVREYSEVVAVLRQRLKRGRNRIIGSGFRWEKSLLVNPVIVGQANQSLDRFASRLRRVAL